MKEGTWLVAWGRTKTNGRRKTLFLKIRSQKKLCAMFVGLVISSQRSHEVTKRQECQLCFFFFSLCTTVRTITRLRTITRTSCFEIVKSCGLEKKIRSSSVQLASQVKISVFSLCRMMRASRNLSKLGMFCTVAPAT